MTRYLTHLSEQNRSGPRAIAPRRMGRFESEPLAAIDAMAVATAARPVTFETPPAGDAPIRPTMRANSPSPVGQSTLASAPPIPAVDAAPEDVAPPPIQLEKDVVAPPPLFNRDGAQASTSAITASPLKIDEDPPPTLGPVSVRRAAAPFVVVPAVPALPAVPAAKPAEVDVPRSAGGPVIQVRIGRVEVRAAAGPAPRPAAVKPGPVLSLEDYLKSRRGDGP